MDSSQNIISIKNISKSFSNIKALDNVSLEINKGELFGLIGPDGAGKTTLFRILATLLIPDKGTARLNKYDSIQDFESIRNIVGYMPGRFSLYQDLTIEENLNFFATVFNTSMEENYDIIRDIYVQIEPFKHRRAGKLSGGMKQKLALCCALIHKPQILLLDELTTGVDPVSRKEFWEMLQNLKKENITIFVSTPYMDEANLCDRIALIQSGNILTVESPEEIIKKYPMNLYAAKSENNYELLQLLRKNPQINSCYIFGEYLHVTFKEDLFTNTGEFIQIKPTIEDCFMHLMKEE